MNRKESLCAVIGGCVGAVLTMMVCSFLPLGAQSQSDGVFEEITCTGLKVVDAEGNIRVLLGTVERGGLVLIDAKEGGSVLLFTTKHGGRVEARGKGSDNLRAVMAVNEYGNGAVSTWDKNGYRLATLK